MQIKSTDASPLVPSAQMFVGEMGCWLVVLMSHLYKRFVNRNKSTDAPLFAGASGYQPVATADNDDDDASTLNPLSAALMPPAEDRAELKGWRIILLALPACCDIAGTTLMNVGLLFVAASIFQMTRGALVLFVGLFSVLFLHRKLYLYQWLSLVVVVGGVAIVGLAGALWNNEKTRDAITGPGAGDQNISDTADTLLLGATYFHESLKNVVREVTTTASTTTAFQTIVGVLLIAGAQIFTATQFVLEEWILEQYALEPLKVVGWEGTFGLLVTLIGMLVLHVTIGVTEKGKYGYFDAVEGWREWAEIPAIGWSSLAIMISIGYVLLSPCSTINQVNANNDSGFNFFGLSVTRSVSATARSTIDTCRTLFIWLVSLALNWETFKWLQVLGFAALVYGTFVFNGIVRPPLESLIPEPESKGLDEEESAEREGRVRRDEGELEGETGGGSLGGLLGEAPVADS